MQFVSKTKAVGLLQLENVLKQGRSSTIHTSKRSMAVKSPITLFNRTSTTQLWTLTWVEHLDSQNIMSRAVIEPRMSLPIRRIDHFFECDQMKPHSTNTDKS